jgi:hypothetical protein
MNLLVAVVIVIVLVGEVSAAEVERLITIGITIDIVSNTIKSNPPRNEERQAHPLGDDRTLFLLLQIIGIRY